MLDNPSLEPYPATPETIDQRFPAAAFRQSTRFNLPLPWLPLRAAGRRYELRSGHAANSTSFLYLMGLPGREVGIRQSRDDSEVGRQFAFIGEAAMRWRQVYRQHIIGE